MLSLFRCIYTGGIGYLFLNWNLFLAFIPWLITSILTIKPNIKKSKIAVAIAIVLWILFFPNAVYIITDLLHLGRRSAMPKWFDMVLILSFAWTGLFFGFFSLFDIEQLLLEKFKKLHIYIATVLLLFVSSYGVFIGRYLRWNSWDIFISPFKLFRDIGNTIFNQSETASAFGMTFFMGLFLNMMYWSLHRIWRTKE
jgi:uncharacterized membrane protein